jgi:hypothetical protein
MNGQCSARRTGDVDSVLAVSCLAYIISLIFILTTALVSLVRFVRSSMFQCGPSTGQEFGGIHCASSRWVWFSARDNYTAKRYITTGTGVKGERQCLEHYYPTRNGRSRCRCFGLSKKLANTVDRDDYCMLVCIVICKTAAL